MNTTSRRMVLPALLSFGGIRRQVPIVVIGSSPFRTFIPFFLHCHSGIMGSISRTLPSLSQTAFKIFNLNKRSASFFLRVELLNIVISLHIKPTIAFEDFEKLDIRVGKVLECENVPKMKKLLKFKIADGLENRTIISGIAQHYKPEELIGKQVLFIANLAPRQFKNGLVSEGMILSAENYDGTLAVTSLLKEVAPGSEVK